MNKIVKANKENTDIDLESIPKEVRDMAESTTYEEIAEGIASSKNAIKLHFLKIGELLYLEQIKFNLDLKKEFGLDNINQVSSLERKGMGYYKYATKKHNMAYSYICGLIRVYKRFCADSQGDSLAKLPFNSYQKLQIVANISDEEIDGILRETFILNNKEV